MQNLLEQSTAVDQAITNDELPIDQFYLGAWKPIMVFVKEGHGYNSFIFKE
jgi:hypothetical protein